MLAGHCEAEILTAVRWVSGGVRWRKRPKDTDARDAIKCKCWALRDTKWHGEQGLGHIGLSGSASIPGPALPSPVTAGGMGGCWRKCHAGCFWRAFPPSLSVKHRVFMRFVHIQGDPQTFLEDGITSVKGFCCWPHQAFIEPSFFARWICITQWE